MKGSFESINLFINILDSSNSISNLQEINFDQNVSLNKIQENKVDLESESESKRKTFQEIRHLILLALTGKRKTINQIAKDIDVNWKTVDNHLIYLMGKEHVKEVFSSEYVRIFEITEKGKFAMLPKSDNAKEKAISSNAEQDEITKEDFELSKEVEK